MKIRPTTAENNPDMRLLTRQTFRFSLDVLDRARRMSITRMSVTRKSISRMSITTMSITTMSITTMSITTMSISFWPGPRRDLQIQQLAALCNNYRLAYILCRGGGGGTVSHAMARRILSVCKQNSALTPFRSLSTMIRRVAASASQAHKSL